MIYRKKPILVNAVQWFPGVKIEGVNECPEISCVCRCHAKVETLEGVMTVSVGDWIITGVMGEKYPCKDNIFKATYELAEKGDLE